MGRSPSPALRPVATLCAGLGVGSVLAVLTANRARVSRRVGSRLRQGRAGRRPAVAENVSLLRGVEPPPGTVLTGTRSEPISVAGEFTSRIEAYTTRLAYTAPEGTSPGEVSTHYLGAFERAGWDFVGVTEDGECYVRGEERACLEPGFFRRGAARFTIEVAAEIP